MSARDPISSPPSTGWQNKASSVKSSPCLHSVTLHKQTNRDKRQPSSCMSKLNSLKAKKRRKHPATTFHLTTHSFWITLEYMRTLRQWGALPWFLMYDYFIWTGEGGRGGAVCGGDWHKPTLGAAFGNGSVETWRIGSAEGTVSPRGAVPS